MTQTATHTASAADKLGFAIFTSRVGAHPACGHNMFAAIAQLAGQKRLSAENMDLFTRAMMARIYRTIPNIAGLVQTALLRGDADMAQTALQNLEEEMGREAPGGKGKTHQQLAQDAFNALRQAYQLPSLTLEQAHNDTPLPESYTQEQLWLSAYRDFPAIASWLQERASGGSGDNQKGMMADMFEVFAANHTAMGDDIFREKVLPYFAAHNRIAEDAGRYRIVFDHSGIEYQHGQRAQSDALREYANLSPERRKVVETMAEAFLDVQEQLFSAILKGVEAPQGRIRGRA